MTKYDEGAFQDWARKLAFQHGASLSTLSTCSMFGVVGMLAVGPRAALRHAPICSMSKPLSVGVIGGGMAGVTAARFLAEAGVEVVLHERAPTLGGRLGTVTVAGRSLWQHSNPTISRPRP